MRPWKGPRTKFSLGSHSLAATPYTEKNKQGTQGDTLRVNFAVKASAKVANFYLINTDANTQLSEITEGLVTELAKLPTENLKIQAVTNFDQIGRVMTVLPTGRPNLTYSTTVYVRAIAKLLKLKKIQKWPLLFVCERLRDLRSFAHRQKK